MCTQHYCNSFFFYFFFSLSAILTKQRQLVMIYFWIKESKWVLKSVVKKSKETGVAFAPQLIFQFNGKDWFADWKLSTTCWITSTSNRLFCSKLLVRITLLQQRINRGVRWSKTNSLIFIRFSQSKWEESYITDCQSLHWKLNLLKGDPYTCTVPL